MSSREQRLSLIRSIVRGGAIKTQKDLVDVLSKHGLECTQATVSRDIAELGLRKLGEGHYILPEDVLLKHMVSKLVTEITAAQNLVVVKTSAGSAQAVAAALDGVQFAEIIGSIAGDDTIMLVATDNQHAIKIVSQIEMYR